MELETLVFISWLLGCLYNSVALWSAACRKSPSIMNQGKWESLAMHSTLMRSCGSNIQVVLTVKLFLLIMASSTFLDTCLALGQVWEGHCCGQCCCVTIQGGKIRGFRVLAPSNLLHSNPSVVIIGSILHVCSYLSLEQAQKPAFGGRCKGAQGQNQWQLAWALKAPAGDLPPKCAQLPPMLKVLSEWWDRPGTCHGYHLLWGAPALSLISSCSS